MARDKRLLGAIAFLISAACAAIVQAAIVRLYIDAAVMGTWTYFAETFGVKPPPNGPNKYCFDYCAADLPFIAGWIAIGSFTIALALVFHAWWKPFRPGI